MARLQGQVTYVEDPMTTSLRGMISQVHLINIYAENVAYADTPGYQKREPVITSFAETLGFKGINKAVKTDAGRILGSGKPLDFALITKGYFQKMQKNGQVQLTRDGRFKLDKEGHLLSEDNMPVLSRQGMPIKLPEVPLSLDDIRVQRNGNIEIIDRTTNTSKVVGSIGIASEDGLPLEEVDVRQRFVEASNVFLHEEFVGMVSPRRNFEANRQMFLIQSQALSKLVSELGRAQ